jgi:hypothetical protein
VRSKIGLAKYFHALLTAAAVAEIARGILQLSHALFRALAAFSNNV